jgi:hypothetical protein
MTVEKKVVKKDPHKIAKGTCSQCKKFRYVFIPMREATHCPGCHSCPCCTKETKKMARV